MNEELLKAIIPLVNSPEWDAFIKYVDERRENLRNILESEQSHYLSARVQGSLNELRMLRNLKETIKTEINHRS